MIETQKTVLIGDDEQESQYFLAMALRCRGYNVDVADNGQEVLDQLGRSSDLSAVFLDVRMPVKDGLDTLREIRSRAPDLPVIMVSASSAPETIVEAMKNGATDYLAKPLRHDEIWKALEEVLEARQIQVVSSRSRERDADLELESDSYSTSAPWMRELAEFIPVVGASNSTVLIQGETGVGKEVLARQLHSYSPRANKAFVKLNCAALPSELVESELFGYEKGAFTGAFQRKPGMFEIASGGTLLLDEIGDMDYKLQSKLLQVLQDYEFQRLGGKETVRVDVRVIAATHNDLETSIEEGKFRRDLYYRLNVVTMYVPPLRERKDTLLALTHTLLKKHSAADASIPELTPQLQDALLAHDWPGNVRELENVVRKLLIFNDQELISRELRSRVARKKLTTAAELDIRGHVQTAGIPTPILEQVTRAKHQAETEAIMAALNSTQWNRKNAAAILKIDYKALLYKMKKLKIDHKVALMPMERKSSRKYEQLGATGSDLL